MSTARAIDVGFAADRAAVVDGVPGEAVVKVYAFSVQAHERGYLVVGAVVNHNLLTDEHEVRSTSCIDNRPVYLV